MEVRFFKVLADRREEFERMKQKRAGQLKKVEVYLDFETGYLYCVDPAGNKTSLTFGEEDLGYIF